ncbi:MAG: hypothetical protein C0476_04770 [Sphingomonas sp.]|nr:hypothetical protein [Sphingomonas sp.]
MPNSIADDNVLWAAQKASAVLARDWRQSVPHRRATDLLDDMRGAAADAVADAVTPLLLDPDWVHDLLTPMIAALARDPWIDPPLRFSRDALRTGAILIDHPAATITAAILSADVLRAQPRPHTIVVPGRLTVVRYHRGGGATLSLWHAGREHADFSAATASPAQPVGAVRLSDGLVRRVDGRTHGQLIEGAQADVVTLTANIRADSATLMREYALDDGRLVRVAALDDAASRTQMLAAYLREAGRTDAADAFARASHDPAPFVRWAVMREWLALNAADALPRLHAMLDDPNSEVRAAAGRMMPLVAAQMLCPV